MNNTLAILLAPLLLWAWAPSLPPAAPQQAGGRAQTAAGRQGLAILRQAMAAMGGDIYLQANDRTVTGRAYGFASTGDLADTGTPFWMFTHFPNEEREELGEKRDVIEIVDGTQGWEITYKGVAPMKASELSDALAIRSHSLDAVLKTWAADPTTLVLYQGMDDVDGQQADGVAFYYRNLEPVIIDFDTESHLPLRLGWRRNDPLTGGYFQESIIYGNWHNVGGVATAMDTARFEGPHKVAQQYLNTVTYAPLPAGLFEPAPLKTRKK